MTKRTSLTITSHDLTYTLRYDAESGTITLAEDAWEGEVLTFMGLRQWNTFRDFILDAHIQLHRNLDRKTISREAQPPTAVS